MNRYFSLRFTLFLLLSDLAIVAAALFISTYIRSVIELGKPILDEGALLPTPVYALALIIWIMVFVLLGVYTPRQSLSLVKELQSLTSASAFAWFSFAGVLYFSFRDVSRLLMVYFLIIYLVLIFAHRAILRLVFISRGSKRFSTRRVVIVGTNKTAEQIGSYIEQNSWGGLSFHGYISANGEMTEAEPILGKLDEALVLIREHGISEIVFAVDPHFNAEAKSLIYALQSLPVNIRIVPDYFDLAFLRLQIEDFGGVALLSLKEPILNPFDRLIKRLFDMAVALIMLIPALPLMGIIAAAIRLDSKGPILFKQQRVGEGGTLFTMYKFRSMVDNAEARQHEVTRTTEDGVILHKTADDPRVTRIGRLLRRTSLDELPQLFNVVMGTMSLVGPRPEVPWMVEKYEAWQCKRFEVPQGMTGWWQINGRSEQLMHLSTEDDLYYILNYSLWLDLVILWRTVGVVLSGRGAF